MIQLIWYSRKGKLWVQRTDQYLPGDVGTEKGWRQKGQEGGLGSYGILPRLYFYILNFMHLSKFTELDIYCMWILSQLKKSFMKTFLLTSAYLYSRIQTASVAELDIWGRV